MTFHLQVNLLGKGLGETVGFAQVYSLVKLCKEQNFLVSFSYISIIIKNMYRKY